MGLADDRKPVNLMTVHVSKSVTVHEVSNNLQKNHTEVEGEDDAEKVYDREFKFQAVKLGREIGFVMTAVEGSRVL